MVSTMSLRMKDSSSRMAGLVAFTLLLLWGQVKESQAGCQRFGHSCFGAHGKRAEIPGGGAEMDTAYLGTGDAPIPNYYPNNRVSPYLIDYLMSMRRDQPLLNYGRAPGLQEEVSMGERRRK